MIKAAVNDLGPCCICERSDETVRNILMLHKQSPYGRGWGCVVCGLPAEGASAVVCDACIKRTKGHDIERKLRFFMVPDGDSYVTGRAPIAELDNQPAWEHDHAKHRADLDAL